MIDAAIIQELILYFAKFVPYNARKEIFKQPTASRLPGYEELKAEVLALPETQAFPDIDSFIISINDKFVSERVRSSKKHLLFVEYGHITLSKPSGIIYNETGLTLSVACELSEANSDMLTEALKMQRNLGIMKVILEDMKMQNDICPAIKYINFPTDLMPLDPSLFFNHAGWAATFSRKKTIV